MPLDPLVALLKPIQTPVAIACSGGLDSVVLLHAAREAGLSPLVLHVDHGIHADSAQWATQLRGKASDWGLAYACERVSGLSSSTPSLENAARNARHGALACLCQAHGVRTLLLAHHANDQAETVLLNLLRGTGLGGVGMPTSRTVGSTLWLRPWLEQPRSAIEHYAAQNQLLWVEDPSNTDQTLRRNAVRHTLWPVVQAVEPRALPSLSRFAGIALEAANTQNALATLCLQPHLRPNKGLDWFAASRDQSPSIQASLLRAWLAQLGCKSPTQARLAGMLTQLNARTGDGLRCNHEGWAFEYRARCLHANAPE